MPGCHPRLLFQVFPVSISRVFHSLLPCDPNCIVTGNLVFIFGTLEKATLRGKRKSVSCLKITFKHLQRKHGSPIGWFAIAKNPMSPQLSHLCTSNYEKKRKKWNVFWCPGFEILIEKVEKHQTKQLLVQWQQKPEMLEEINELHSSPESIPQNNKQSLLIRHHPPPAMQVKYHYEFIMIHP